MERGSLEPMKGREQDVIQDVFRELRSQFADHYQCDMLADAQIVFSFDPVKPRDRSFPMEVSERKVISRSSSGNYDKDQYQFIFRSEDFHLFQEEFTNMFCGEDGFIDYGVGRLAHEMFVGASFGQVIAQDRVLALMQNTKKSTQIRNFFFDKSDIEETFREFFMTEAHEEVDPVWMLSQHIGDQRTARINSMRASLEYFWNVFDARNGEAIHMSTIQAARKMFLQQMTTVRSHYLLLGEFAFNKSTAECNRIFTEWLSEWLLAMAIPMDISPIEPKVPFRKR